MNTLIRKEDNRRFDIEKPVKPLPLVVRSFDLVPLGLLGSTRPFDPFTGNGF